MVTAAAPEKIPNSSAQIVWTQSDKLCLQRVQKVQEEVGEGNVNIKIFVKKQSVADSCHVLSLLWMACVSPPASILLDELWTWTGCVRTFALAFLTWLFLWSAHGYVDLSWLIRMRRHAATP